MQRGWAPALSVDDGDGGGGCVSGLFTCADGASRADGEEGKRCIRTQTQSATGGEKKDKDPNRWE